MKYSKILTCVLLLIGAMPSLLQGAGTQSNDFTIAYLYNLSGTHKIKKEWHTPSTILEKQPIWDGMTGNPPLAVGSACSAAFQKVWDRFPDIKNWQVETIRIRNLCKGGETGKSYSYPNVWYYQITLVPEEERLREKLEREGLDHECTQVVLMDGTIVTPVIVK